MLFIKDLESFQSDTSRSFKRNSETKSLPQSEDEHVKASIIHELSFNISECLR